ncbi:MAG: hypothetical protein AB7O88_26385 [Reyranellaceae bacterium]
MADTGPAPKKLAMSHDYIRLMGLFQGLWASVELTTDYAIGKFLSVTPRQCHLITSGMMFGAKARLLADLIRHSRHKNKAAISAAFGKMRGVSKRDVFAHAYVWSNANSVVFIERTRGGDYHAKRHTFTLAEFGLHVLELSNAATDFYKALGVTSDQLDAFANAAFSRERKSKRSPGRPTSKKR